jgi:Transposase DDE domain
MNASALLWENWQEQVKQLLEGIHGHQKKSLALMVLAIVLSGSAVLQRMAESAQQYGMSAAKMPSIERRLARFVANDRILVPRIWKLFLAQVLVCFGGQRLWLVLDCTPIDERACIVYLGVLVHSRVLPVAWRVMPMQEHWEQGQWDLVGAMLDELKEQLPTADCTLIADRGLSGMPLVKLCRDRQWHYLLRIAKEHTFRRRLKGKGQKWSRWMACGLLAQKEGQRWFGAVQVWQEDQLDTYLSAVWEPGYQEAWLLISDQGAGRLQVAHYAWRMRVESTFQDTKSRGWELEATLIADRARLNRLLLALFLAIWWVSHLAASCIHHGKRDQFDRHDRRDKGIFRLGRLWLLDILRRAKNRAALKWCLPFKKQAHGWRFSLRF